MISKLIPWKMLLQRAAHHYGFIDPLSFMARMRKFSQPSEVQEPIELLRAGVAFHARGLLNTRAIQNNLDWVWPYWVERQFNPEDPSFLPRAFSFSHVNLTHRNWTAVGHPQLAHYPVVDPRGLVTPLFDGWSIDFWLLTEDGEWLIPSRSDNCRQTLAMDSNLEVNTSVSGKAAYLESNVALLYAQKQQAELHIQVKAEAVSGGKLIAVIRPYNAEGIQFVEHLRFDTQARALHVNHDTRLIFSESPKQVHYSNYEYGDVLHFLQDNKNSLDEFACPVGMATGAAEFPIPPAERHKTIDIRVPLAREIKRESEHHTGHQTEAIVDWPAFTQKFPQLSVPDKNISRLYDIAARTLTLLSAEDPVPGPYIYKRFWFRDACLMIQALLALNLDERVGKVLERFPQRQKRSGYFQSQEGEWDSNGQVLWTYDQYEKLSGKKLSDKVMKSVRKAVAWIDRKRLPESGDELHAGLLPSGFSAEHFGPNDYYFWDDYWALAGLDAAANIYRRHGETALADAVTQRANSFRHIIERCLQRIPEHRSRGGIPAAPYRRMDAGAIGSLVADYPLQLYPAGDPRIRKTLDYLMQHCFHKGAFFQDMIHSGVNAYLTLDIAQTLLRDEDPRYEALVRRVAELASPTGNWPEAIHPHTGGGCMGDGQHGWAAAEWVMMIRNMFIREEDDGLVVGAGLFPEWMQSGATLVFGPTNTSFGSFQIRVHGSIHARVLSVSATGLRGQPRIHVSIPGYRKMEYPLDKSVVTLEPLKEKVHEYMYAD